MAGGSPMYGYLAEGTGVDDPPDEQATELPACTDCVPSSQRDFRLGRVGSGASHHG